MDKIYCYIEEYKDEQGNLCAKLKERDSDKIVVITSELDIKKQFLEFLSVSRTNTDKVPTIFEKTGNDAIEAIGKKTFETERMIEIHVGEPGTGFKYVKMDSLD